MASRSRKKTVSRQRSRSSSTTTRIGCLVTLPHYPAASGRLYACRMAEEAQAPLDEETEERIEHPVSAEAERETRLTPSQAVEGMRIRVPVRGNRKLRTLIERVNVD